MTSLESSESVLKRRLDIIKYNEKSTHSSRVSPLSSGIQSEPIILESEPIDKSLRPDKRVNQSSIPCTSLIVELTKYTNLIDCILSEQTSSLDDFRKDGPSSNGAKRRKLTKNLQETKKG